LRCQSLYKERSRALGLGRQSQLGIHGKSWRNVADNK
jgi:hypothetical protein